MVKFPIIHKKRCMASLVAIFFTIVSLNIPAWAQEGSLSRKNIAIVGFQHGLYRDDEEKVYNKIRSTLQSMEEFQVLDASTVEMGVMQSMSRKSQNASKKIQKAYEQFVQGVEHYRTLDLPQAIRDLNRAVKGYREGIGSLEDNHYLLYSHLYLGMALYFDGRVKEGEKLIQEMVKLDAQRKTRKLPLRDFPPKIVDIHKKQTNIVQKLPHGTILVDSNPSSARVMLDGMDVGETPITLSNVPTGQHFIAIDQAGHDLYKQLLDVKQGEQNIIANLKPQKMFLAKNQFEQEQDAAQTRTLQKMAKELSVDYFILGQIDPKDKQYTMKLQSYDVIAGSYSSVFAKDLGTKQRKIDGKVAKTTDDWVNSVVKKSSMPVTGAVDFQKDFQEPDFGKKPKKKKGFNKKILWIGLGVLAAGTGAYFIFSGSGSATSNVLSVDNPLN